MRQPVLRWVAMALLAMACSAGSANLTGAVAVTGPSGETRPGSQVDVILVPAGGTFEVEWNQMVEGFGAQRARALAVATEAEGVQAHASAERLAASQAALGLLARGSDASVDWKAYDHEKHRQIAAVEQSLKAAERGRNARKQIERLAARVRRDAWHLITSHQVRRVRTDDQGRFAFDGASPGRYYLASRVQMSGGDRYWFVPLDLGPAGKHAMDLTDRNAGWPFS